LALYTDWEDVLTPGIGTGASELKATAPISVVIPTYNFGPFLARAIHSVLEQTCPVLEIIVVDDGSSDETRDVAASFGDRIRYIRQQNRGVSAARNRGIAETRGEWIGFLDADDWWMPHKNEKVQEFLHVHPEAVMIYHPNMVFYTDGRPQEFRRALEPDKLWPSLRHWNEISGGSSALVRRSLLLDLGGFNEKFSYGEDWDLWIRIAVRHRLHKISEPLSGVLFHDRNATNSHVLVADGSRQIVDALSNGLHGIERLLYRQRFLAFRSFDASLELRPLDSAAARRYLIRSLRDWPSPFYRPERWWALCLTLAGRLEEGEDLLATPRRDSRSFFRRWRTPSASR